MPTKIIIDTDPGIDDAMAIFYALQAPELEVLGLTTVFGNAATTVCTRNALRLTEIAGRADLPVAAGAEGPLVGPARRHADFVHGADGQGETHLPPPTRSASPLSATAFICDQARRAPGEVTLVAIGPLTNLALALQHDPGLPALLRGVIVMGGNAFGPGNASPAAEANVLSDPTAADLVFGADCPLTMCGLDVTERIIMSSHALDRLAGFPNPRAQHLARILPFYRNFYRTRAGLEGIPVHDSTPITYLRAPELFRTVPCPIRVDTTTGLGRGKTWPALGRSDQEQAWQGRRPVTICVGVEAEQAVALELELLAQG